MSSAPQNTTDPYYVDSTTATAGGLGTGHHRADAREHNYPSDNTTGYSHQAASPHYNAPHSGHDNRATAQQYPPQQNQPLYAPAHASDHPHGMGPARGALIYAFLL